MVIRTVKFSEIVPDDFNPRKPIKPGTPRFEKLKRSLDELGYLEVIVFNERTGHLVNGHQRVTVMEAMGLTEAEMSIVNMSEYDEKKLGIRLNKIKGRWDYSKLADLFNGFSMDEALLTGFDSDEIALILAKGDDFDMEDYDDGSGDEGEESGEEEDDGDIVPEDFEGASWVITLKFDTADEAKAWCEEHGHPGAVKKNSSTTVIRMGEG